MKIPVVCSDMYMPALHTSMPTIVLFSCCIDDASSLARIGVRVQPVTNEGWQQWTCEVGRQGIYQSAFGLYDAIKTFNRRYKLTVETEGGDGPLI